MEGTVLRLAYYTEKMATLRMEIMMANAELICHKVKPFGGSSDIKKLNVCIDGLMKELETCMRQVEKLTGRTKDGKGWKH